MMLKGKVNIIYFFFNARGDDLEKSTTGMYRSLLLQLLKQHPRLQTVFNSLGLATRNNASPMWTVETLKALFEQAVHGLGKSTLMCFVDALDECDESQIRDMISFFEHVGEKAMLHGIIFQICFSSRYYPHITILKGLDLKLEKQEGHDYDIVRYVDRELKIGQSKLAKHIRASLIEKASGVFMWVVLVVEILQWEHDHGHKHKLKQKLQDIPRDLHKLFREILTRDSHHKDELLLCIQWVLFARQPLTPEQLYLAVLSGVDPETASEWSPDEIEEQDIKKFILSSSKGLVEVTRSKRSPKTQFIHESVRDFLLKENELREIWPDLGGNFQGESHERLKQCCLGYMRIGFAVLTTSKPLLTHSSFSAVLDALPFIEYAVRNVLYHADAADGGGVSQESFIQNFQVEVWVKLEHSIERHNVRRHSYNTSLLYLLAEYNASNLIGRHPDKLSYFREEGERYGLPFLAALATGSREAVWAFLKAQSDTQPPVSSLHDLSENYYKNGSKRTGIGRDFKFSPRRSPLSYLAEAGDEFLLAFFLTLGNHDADIESKDQLGRTSLGFATSGGHEAAVRLLLDKGANVGAKDKYGRSPLSLACEKGHEPVVRLLLAWDADIEAADDKGWTPISLATIAGHEAVVKLLLDKGANIEAADNRGQTPLSLAAKGGHETTVRLLLDEGANIEAADNDSLTPLSWAAWGGHKAIIRLLLNKGASIEAADNYGQTPLSLAAKGGNEATVRLLLDEGANIDAADNRGQMPLVRAALEGNEAIVRLLLNKGANIEVADNYGQTPLLWAAERGYKAIIRLLLNKGANIEAADNHSQTPLSLAAEGGDEATVQLLLDKGANIEAADNDGLTSLSLAAWEGHEATVRLLLDNGANIKTADNHGRTLLFFANTLSKGFIKQLLDKGANIEAADNNGRTPLS